MTNIIKLSDIIRIDNLEDYKFHPACKDSGNEDSVEPLDEYIQNRDALEGWNSWRHNVDEFGDRPFIFTMMKFHYEPHMWLFGGIFVVLDSTGKKNTAGSYKVVELKGYSKYVGKLKIKFKRKQGEMRKAFNLENYYPKLEVVEILREPYSGSNSKK